MIPIAWLCGGAYLEQLHSVILCTKCMENRKSQIKSQIWNIIFSGLEISWVVVQRKTDVLENREYLFNFQWWGWLFMVNFVIMFTLVDNALLLDMCDWDVNARSFGRHIWVSRTLTCYFNYLLHAALLGFNIGVGENGNGEHVFEYQLQWLHPGTSMWSKRSKYFKCSTFRKYT